MTGKLQEESQRETEGDSWSERFFIGLLRYLRQRFSLSNKLPEWFPSLNSPDFVDAYVMVCLALLLTLVFLLRLLSDWFGWDLGQWTGWGAAVVILIAVYRVIDILTCQLNILLVDSQRNGWKRHSLQRSFLLACFNFAEIVAAFALLYLNVRHIFPLSSVHRLDTPVNALYFSLVTVTTVGFGDLWPVDDLSQTIVIGEVLTGVVFLLAAIPALLANISAHMGEGHTKE